jgi:hypothetical protein
MMSTGEDTSQGQELPDKLPSPMKSAAMKMASTPTENKPFTARYGAAPIFMLGGAPRAHEVF